jgi:hypothetical protein
MGTLGGGDGGNRPPEGSGLPGLPPEWGTVIVPDDLSELADEVAAVRRELHLDAPQPAWRVLLRRLAGPRVPGPSLRFPLLIMALAIVATLTGLFTLAWPKQRPAAPQAHDAGQSVPAIRASTIPALELADANGQVVPLRGLLPAAILLTGECACTELVAGTAAAAPPGVSVVIVVRRAVAPREPGLARVRALADPAGELRAAVGLDPPPGKAGILLVARDASIVLSLPAESSVAAFKSELTSLGAR